MRELIQSFKYRDRHEGLHLFGRWLKKAGAGLFADADLILPVPLYRSRLWWRRFNQSAMLALTLSRLSGVPVDCLVLKRVRRTASQVGLSADQRRRNVAGAFRVEKSREAKIKGRNLVVVDDVITTGDGRGVRAGAEAVGSGKGRYPGAGPRRRARRLRALVLCRARFEPSYREGS
jgi:ComF family protein